MLSKKTIRKMLSGILGVSIALGVSAAPDESVQKIRFVEDDAQNYMTSKIYELKYQKANDLVPFVLGAIKRYAKNGSADRINYSAGKKQLLAVSCPVPLIPYIDDMVKKLDRPSKGADGSGIDGTGIIRSVFTPQYRAAESMVKVMTDTGISSNATEGANQDAVVAFDAPTNRIYWKDSSNKDADLKKYLAWLDRPVPQFIITMQLYEVRESDLTDVGLDYLAWKNGPGLDLFQAGGVFMEGSALSNTFGPYGYFLFKPSFDFSFLRVMQQNGKAQIANSSALSISTGKPASLSFTPSYQSLLKDKDFAASIKASGNNLFELAVNSPVISLSGATNSSGLLGFSAEDYASQIGVLNFQYILRQKNVVERDNMGNELIEESNSNSFVTIQTGCERMLNYWSMTKDIEQTIGIPFLCELPILKYIFGTTTTTKEKYLYFLSVKAELIHPDTDIAAINGRLISIPDLVK